VTATTNVDSGDPLRPTRRFDPLEPWPDSVEWRRVSSKLILLKQVHLLVWAVILIIACGVLWQIAERPLAITATVASVALVLLRAVLVVRSVRSWGYAERAEDLLVRHGIFIRRLSIVPYARMQFVDVTAGPLERALGLATVSLHTAAAASDATVPGLEGDEATRLRDRLAALGEIRTEGL
jgi:membrane protein YdbS with pleckstrin-like domain